jgi:hypothetical protein
MIKIDNEKVGEEVTNIILEQVDTRHWQKKNTWSHANNTVPNIKLVKLAH